MAVQIYDGKLLLTSTQPLSIESLTEDEIRLLTEDEITTLLEYDASGEGPLAVAVDSACCCMGCVYFRDYFDRADSTDLGSDWSEDAGSWSISSQELLGSSANGVCACQESHPDGDDEFVVSAKVTLQASSSVARIIVDYTDTSNYTFAEYSVSGGTATLALYVRSGGSNSLQDSTTFTWAWSTSIWLMLCVRGDVVKVSTSATGSSWAGRIAEFITTTGSSAGCGTGSTGNVKFDSFQLSQHGDVVEDCEACAGECSHFVDDAAPGDIQAVIAGVVQGPGDDADCPSVNGTWQTTQTSDGCYYRSAEQAWSTQPTCFTTSWLVVRFVDPTFILNPVPGATHAIAVYMSGPSDTCVWVKGMEYFYHSQVGKYTIAQISGLLLTAANSSGVCDFSGASCSLTAT